MPGLLLVNKDNIWIEATVITRKAALKRPVAGRLERKEADENLTRCASVDLSVVYRKIVVTYS